MSDHDSPPRERIPKEKMDGFLKVSEALKTIRDRRLYREQFASFDAYCRARVGLPGDMVNRMLAEADLELEMRKRNPEAQ